MDYYLNINQGVSVVYGAYDRSINNVNKGHFAENEVVDNKVKGEYSVKSKKRFSSIIKNWISVLEANNLKNYNGRRAIEKDLRFVTLTLSSKQKHNDQFIRRMMLNRFIKIIKLKFSVMSYIYCSESQKNGNIHFHIVIDKYINYKDIQIIWNKIQATYGYIEAFKEKHGHENPNSTDIHSFRKVHSIAAYLIKYFTKDESRRKIDGRLWGSSDNLKQLEHYSTIVTYHEAEMFNKIKKANKARYYAQDYFTIYSGIRFIDFKEYSEQVYQDLIEFYSKQIIHLNMKCNEKRNQDVIEAKESAIGENEERDRSSIIGGFELLGEKKNYSDNRQTGKMVQYSEIMKTRDENWKKAMNDRPIRKAKKIKKVKPADTQTSLFNVKPKCLVNHYD